MARVWIALTAASLAGSVAAAPVGPALDAKPSVGPEGTYGETCAYCHGSNVGPIILGRHLPADMIKGTVRAGRGAMPAFRPTEISDADLAALADWISMSKPDASEHGK